MITAPPLPESVPDGKLAPVCGRYALRTGAADLVEEFEVDEDTVGGTPGSAEGAPGLNVAPTTSPPVVLERVPKGEPEALPVRSLRRLRWGLVPSWAKDPSVGNRMVNARVETLLEKPAFAKAAVARRCLVPVDAWYEWQRSPLAEGAGGKPRTQPFAVRSRDGSRLSLAGIYEFWRDRDRPDDDPDRWLVSFAIITTEAEPGLDRLHDRMPLVVPADLRDAWLEPERAEPEEVREVLEAVPRDLFETALDAFPVSRRVGNVRAQDPGLLDPAPAAELEGVVDLRTGEVIGS
ncbi:putative SOS response-associated peptidase YedK [Kineococcus xinjiangensis]|uniref:Abasic site processing protein n=1 Tax=Kineococcus xinjiangensis TaxID=512762 RepID=A0A2S6IWJ9_9ACTN|nr:SOS response-associated peptidase [Kineococcus xinjiangensis]PPK98718.1 putative SOS response-associated peptidase YedK [Kineococcus xinjiangensis]